jgi:hypothetical protein
MRTRALKSIALTVLVAFTSAVSGVAAHADDLSSLSTLGANSRHEGAGGMGGAEYVSGNYPGAILMPVNLWGAVGKPGIHHVPTQTDLVTLLSLAGGPGADAEIDHITIKRRFSGEEQVIRVDADDILNKPGVRSPVLEANDIIIVPREKPPISNTTLTTVTFAATVLSAILAGVAISIQLKNK